MKKFWKIPAFFLAFSVWLLRPQIVLAVCPVCTATVVVGLGFSRWLGVDDSVSGVWIGAVLLSSSLWFANWLSKKYSWARRLKSLKLMTAGLTYLLVFVPLARTEILGHPFNRLWGIDKLILGTGVGTIAFWLGTWADQKVRLIRGKQLFNYQKIIFPVALLILLSVVSWLITKP